MLTERFLVQHLVNLTVNIVLDFLLHLGLGFVRYRPLDGNAVLSLTDALCWRLSGGGDGFLILASEIPQGECNQADEGKPSGDDVFDETRYNHCF